MLLCLFIFEHTDTCMRRCTNCSTIIKYTHATHLSISCCYVSDFLLFRCCLLLVSAFPSFRCSGLFYTSDSLSLLLPLLFIHNLNIQFEGCACYSSLSKGTRSTLLQFPASTIVFGSFSFYLDAACIPALSAILPFLHPSVSPCLPHLLLS